MAATGDPVPCSFCGKYGHDFGEVCRGITNTYPTTPVNSPTPPPAPEPSEEIRRVVRIFEGCRVPLPGDCEGCDALATLIEKREAPLRRDLEAARGERCPHAFDLERDGLYEASPEEAAGREWCGNRGFVGIVTIRRDAHRAIGRLLNRASELEGLLRECVSRLDADAPGSLTLENAIDAALNGRERDYEPVACGTFTDIPEVDCFCKLKHGAKDRGMRVHLKDACYRTIEDWKAAKDRALKSGERGGKE